MTRATCDGLKSLGIRRPGCLKSMSLIALRNSMEIYHQFMDYAHVLRAGHTYPGGAEASPLGPLHPAGGGSLVGRRVSGDRREVFPGQCSERSPLGSRRPLVREEGFLVVLHVRQGEWRNVGKPSPFKIPLKATSSRLAPYEGSPGLGLRIYSISRLRGINKDAVLARAERARGQAAARPPESCERVEAAWSGSAALTRRAVGRTPRGLNHAETWPRHGPTRHDARATARATRDDDYVGTRCEHRSENHFIVLHLNSLQGLRSGTGSPISWLEHAVRFAYAR
ncbi:hypothetical protein J6590_007607 [Homalodisca vitripennis]|nr:hypothetical protein J6590_007607 [Homalodisca vitripennis]